MNISFPIDNFSQTYNILSELFEFDIIALEDSFTFNWDGNGITFTKLRHKGKSNAQNLISIELFHLHRSYSEMEKRMEFYFYKHQISSKSLGITMEKKNHSISWKISSSVNIEIFFSSELSVPLIELNS